MSKTESTKALLKQQQQALKTHMAFEDNYTEFNQLHSSDHLREQVADIGKTEIDVSNGEVLNWLSPAGEERRGREREKLAICCLYDSQQRKQEKIMNCYKTNTATGHMILSTKTQLLNMVRSDSLYTMAVTGGDG